MSANTNLLLVENDRVALAAHKLTIFFSDNADLPLRFRESSGFSRNAVRKQKEDTKIDRLFKANVSSWEKTIKTMLGKIDKTQAWRFINLSPECANSFSKVTHNKDFLDFVTYMALRRDDEHCDPNELGLLALMSAELQRRIEVLIRN